MRPTCPASLSTARAGLTPSVVTSEDFSCKERAPSWLTSKDFLRARARLVVMQAVRAEGEVWPERLWRCLRLKGSPGQEERKEFLAAWARSQFSPWETFLQTFLSQLSHQSE